MWTLAAIGDLFLNRADGQHVFDPVLPELMQADVRFANCEGAYTDTAEVAVSAGFRVAAAKERCRPLAAAAIDIYACANNHLVDAAHAGVGDTLDALAALGAKTVGAGRDRHEAERALRFTRGAADAVFLAFTCVYQAGYGASLARPGVAAIRVHTAYYFPDWDPYGRLEPGAVPHTATMTDPDDLSRLIAAVHAAAEAGAPVIVSFHWGDSRLPWRLCEYERELGRAAIDAGASCVLGHHHHFIKGVEVYKGKPILYGLGHFVFDLIGLEAAVTPEQARRLAEFSAYAIYPRPTSPDYPFHEDTRFTVVAKLCFEGVEVVSAQLVPCWIEAEANRPVPLRRDSSRGAALMNYLQKANRIGRCDTSLQWTRDGSADRIAVAGVGRQRSP